MHIKAMKERPYSVNSLEVNNLKEQRRILRLFLRQYYPLQEGKVVFSKTFLGKKKEIEQTSLSKATFWFLSCKQGKNLI